MPLSQVWGLCKKQRRRLSTNSSHFPMSHVPQRKRDPVLLVTELHFSWFIKKEIEKKNKGIFCQSQNGTWDHAIRITIQRQDSETSTRADRQNASDVCVRLVFCQLGFLKTSDPSWMRERAVTKLICHFGIEFRVAEYWLSLEKISLLFQSNPMTAFLFTFF